MLPPIVMRTSFSGSAYGSIIYALGSAGRSPQASKTGWPLRLTSAWTANGPISISAKSSRVIIVSTCAPRRSRRSVRYWRNPCGCTATNRPIFALRTATLCSHRARGGLSGAAAGGLRGFGAFAAKARDQPVAVPAEEGDGHARSAIHHGDGHSRRDGEGTARDAAHDAVRHGLGTPRLDDAGDELGLFRLDLVFLFQHRCFGVGGIDDRNPDIIRAEFRAQRFCKPAQR